jgi:hypothetical protein
LKTQVIFLKIKAISWLGLLCVLFVVTLLAFSLLICPDQWENLLLVTPADYASPSFDPEALEQFCEDEFLVTYEIPEVRTAEAVYSRHQISAVGTNSSYYDLMGYPLLSGCFFTKAAWNAKEKYAVLNEIAAYELFGSINIIGRTLKIGGDTWLVAGVLGDGDDEHLNIYVPSSITGGQADSLLALLDADAGITEAYALNTLKELGVGENSCTIVNLSAAANIYRDWFSVAWRASACTAIALFMLLLWLGMKNRLSFCRDMLKQKYFRELFAEHRMEFIRMAVTLLLLLAGIAGIVILLVQILAACLSWQGAPTLGGLPTEGGIMGKTAVLQACLLPGTVVFAALLVTLALLLVLVWKRLQRNTNWLRSMEVRLDG